MRSNFLIRKAATSVIRLRAAGMDRELIGLCLVLLMVISGHLLTQHIDQGAAPAHLTSLTMMQP